VGVEDVVRGREVFKRMLNSKLIGGILLIVFGVVVLIYGDKKLNVDEGRIGRLFFPPSKSSFNSKIWKWFLGIISILAGISFVF
jgi:hypothetical protein